MTYLNFHRQWHDLGYFTIHQVLAWDRYFNRFNLRNWIRKGYIVPLRKGYYAFADCKKIPDFSRYLANRIYRPSYISLHTALSYYGMIPESVIQITSVTSLKTNSFTNDFGEYSYSSVKNEMMFGYEPKPLSDGRSIFIATPEKALLDLLYLNPFYKTESDMIELRLDDAYLEEDLNIERMEQYRQRIGNKSLDKRIETLFKAYAL